MRLLRSGKKYTARELFTAVSAGFFGVQILSPFQILWIFLVSGCFPAHLLSRIRLWKRCGRNGKCRDRDAPGASGRSDAICGERDTFPGKWIGIPAIAGNDYLRAVMWALLVMPVMDASKIALADV